MEFCPISTYFVSPESGEPETVWSNEYLNEYWNRTSSLHSVRFFLRFEFEKRKILIKSRPWRRAQNSLKLFAICGRCWIRRSWDGLRSLWSQNLPKRSRKHLFNGSNIRWSGTRSKFQVKMTFSIWNGLIWYEIDYFRTEMTFSIFWKPVDCSGFDFSSVYDRKRRSDHEEYPLVAQLSTSIQISVIETFSEQPIFEDILQ